MSVYEPLLNFFSTLGAYVIGTAVSALVLGFMLDKFVLKKIWANKKIKRLEGQIDKILDRLDQLVDDRNGKKEGHSAESG